MSDEQSMPKGSAVSVISKQTYTFDGFEFDLLSPIVLAVDLMYGLDLAYRARRDDQQR